MQCLLLQLLQQLVLVLVLVLLSVVNVCSTCILALKCTHVCSTCILVLKYLVGQNDAESLTTLNTLLVLKYRY